MHWVGILFGLVLASIAIVFFLMDNFNLFSFIIGLGIASMIFPFIVEISIQNKKEQDINERFLEFSRTIDRNTRIDLPFSVQ